MIALLAAGKGMCADSSNANANDPLLDLFIKKGYVTKEEADQVKAEAEAQRCAEEEVNQLAELEALRAAAESESKARLAEQKRLSA